MRKRSRRARSRRARSRRGTGPTVFAVGLSIVLAMGARAAPPDAGASSGAAVSQSELLAFLAGAGGTRASRPFTLIDARSPEEFAAAHVDGAVNIPHDAADVPPDALPESPDAPLVVYCRTGKRAAKLAAALAELGYRNVRTLRPEQIHWSDGFAVFNCAADDPAPPTALDAPSTDRKEGESS